MPDKQTVSLFFLLCCQCTTRIMFKILYRCVFCLFSLLGNVTFSAQHLFEMFFFDFMSHSAPCILYILRVLNTNLLFFPSSPKLKVPHVKSINFLLISGALQRSTHFMKPSRKTKRATFIHLLTFSFLPHYSGSHCGVLAA